jgi:hypothetical protein
MAGPYLSLTGDKEADGPLWATDSKRVDESTTNYSRARESTEKSVVYSREQYWSARPFWSAPLCIIQSGNGFALVLADEVRPNIVARRAWFR